MIKRGTGETGANTMAHTAILTIRGRMIRCHSYCPSPISIMSSIMARGTITGDTRVIEDRWVEHIVSVTNVTVLNRW